MTTYKATDASKWARKSKRRMDYVVKQASADLMEEASHVAPGKNRGGSVTKGFVPRDTGFLARSLVTDFEGGVFKGEDSYVLAISQLKAGDTIKFGWTAEYARPVHYRGWLWRDAAAAKWNKFVREAIAKGKLVDP